MVIGTLTTGAAVTTTFDINYVPAYLYYIAATQLTSIKVTVAGDGVIFDGLAAALSGAGVIGRIGEASNSYLIPLATGLLPDKTCRIVCTNSAAQTPVLYGFSFNKSANRNTPRGVYVQTVGQQVLQDSHFTFRDFLQLIIDTPDTDDIVLVEFQDGHQEEMHVYEFIAWVTLYATNYNNYVIPNINQRINYVRYSAKDSDRTIYVSKYVQP